MPTLLRNLITGRLARRLVLVNAIVLVVMALVVLAVVLLLLRRMAVSEATSRLELHGTALAETLLRSSHTVHVVARTMATLAAGPASGDALLRQQLPRLLDDGNPESIIAGGGFWAEPYRRDPAKLRDCLFWGRQADGGLKYFDDYNQSDSPPYQREEWYVPARDLPPGAAYWSWGYVDPYSHEPMTTCTVPVHRDGTLIGVVTVDVRLSGMSRLCDRLASGISGAVLVFDRRGMLLNRPDRLPAIPGAPAPTLASLQAADPGYGPMLDRIVAMRGRNPADPGRIERILAGDSTQIDRGYAELIARDLAALDLFAADQVPASMLPHGLLALDRDPLLHESSQVVHVHLPGTNWHLMLGVPTQITFAQADRLTTWIAIVLLALVMATLAAAHLVTHLLVTRPLGELATIIGHAGNLPLDPAMNGLSARRDELGQVIAWIVRRDHQLFAARTAAEAAAAAKASFLANMSHEIRTPITGILGMAQVLELTELDNEQRDYLNTLTGSGQALLTVINDILDFSRLESRMLHIESIPYNLRHLVYEVTDLFRTRPDQRPVELLADLDAEVPTNLVGDPGRIRQVLTNLVGNALKFTHQGHVLIRARWSDGTLTMQVEDTGIGIPDDRQPFLFQPFMQADVSTTRRYGGTGLGLAICHHLIELMGGRITLDSSKGSGTTFTMVMPAVAHETGTRIGPRVKRLDRIRIGLFSLPGRGREVLERQLRDLGAKVIGCATADDAIGHSLQDTGTIDALIIDLHRNEEAATRVAGHLRTITTARPLVAIAAVGLRGDGEQLRAAGFSGYLVNPVTDEHLAGVIGGVLSPERDPNLLITRHTLGRGTERISAGSGGTVPGAGRSGA